MVDDDKGKWVYVCRSGSREGGRWAHVCTRVGADVEGKSRGGWAYVSRSGRG